MKKPGIITYNSEIEGKVQYRKLKREVEYG
jgi:hypothetical protein